MRLAELREELRAHGPRSVVGLYGIRDHGQFAGPRWTHDHNAACYGASGRLQWYFELERLSGLKHDNRLEQQWSSTPLRELGERPDAFVVGSVTSFAGTSFVASDGRLRIDGGPPPPSLNPAVGVARCSVGNDPLTTLPAWTIAQELAHPFSGVAFAGVPRLPALLVHADGAASVSSFSAFLWTEDEIYCLEADWDTVYEAMNFGFNDLYHEILGQDDNTRLATAGRLMGLAAFSVEADPQMLAWLDDNAWFRRHWANPAHFFAQAKARFGWAGELRELRDPFVQALAGCAQARLVQVILTRLRRLAQRTGVRTLYAGGGVFLNIHLNAAIETCGLFDRVIIPPNTTDCGLGLGAACLLSWVRDEVVVPVTPFIQHGSTTGLATPTTNSSQGKALLVDQAATRLLNGQAIALITGAGEAGPRALGHRSILCLPTAQAASRVSAQLKGREWYRPVAPIGLANVLQHTFGGDLNSPLLRWMLTTRRPENLDPRWMGAVHVDGTSRLQVVDSEDIQHPLLVAILQELWDRARVPCLINTSLNGPGVPIANAHAEALSVARGLRLDGALVDEAAYWWCAQDQRWPGFVEQTPSNENSKEGVE